MHAPQPRTHRGQVLRLEMRIGRGCVWLAAAGQMSSRAQRLRSSVVEETWQGCAMTSSVGPGMLMGPPRCNHQCR